LTRTHPSLFKPSTARLTRLDSVNPTAIERIESTEEGQAFLSSFYSDEEYTIFAPTDQAFKGYGLDSSNIRKENAYWLQDVLKYHVSCPQSSRRQCIERRAWTDRDESGWTDSEYRLPPGRLAFPKFPHLDLIRSSTLCITTTPPSHPMRH
jgi:hypothetical protein